MTNKDLTEEIKKQYDVQILLKSVNTFGQKLTTFQLKYPRIIHSEFMTHRVFSRNASSSRAIPVKKVIEQVRNNPAGPIHWGKNQSGMQANEELFGSDRLYAQKLWLDAARIAADIAEEMMSVGLHKQVANRILEPYQWMHVVLTTSHLTNYYNLRCHKDAAPEIKYLADLMKDLDEKTEATLLKDGDFHLPYIKKEEFNQFKIEDLIKFSVARCARVSYLTHDNETPKPEDDLKLYDRLLGADPIHASPSEHQARPATSIEVSHGQNGFSGNFSPTWRQHRKYIEDDIVRIFVEPIEQSY